METLEINDLELIRAEFDYVEKKLVCFCIDTGYDSEKKYTKVYYLPFDRLRWLDYENQVKQVMTDGWKFVPMI